MTIHLARIQPSTQEPCHTQKNPLPKTPLLQVLHTRNLTRHLQNGPLKKNKFLLKPSFLILKFFYGFVFGLPLLKNHRVQGTCNAYTVASNTYPDLLQSNLYFARSTQTPRDLNWKKKDVNKKTGRKWGNNPFLCFLWVRS